MNLNFPTSTSSTLTVKIVDSADEKAWRSRTRVLISSPRVAVLTSSFGTINTADFVVWGTSVQILTVLAISYSGLSQII